MRIEEERAHSQAHSRLHGRLLVHTLVVVIAVASAVFFAPRPGSSASVPIIEAPRPILSGLAASTVNASAATVGPGASLMTQDSVAMLVRPPAIQTVRVTGAISPSSSFSVGVALAAAASGESGAGVMPLAEVVDPSRPFVLYAARPGDSASSIADKFGISLGTLLDNNPTVEDRDLIQRGQELIVPREEGILYKIAYGDTLDDIVDQFDDITVSKIASYRPNGLQLDSTLRQGEYLLLVGAKRKPPPPPPPQAATPGGIAAPPAGDGRFSFPLANWLAVSDPFGTDRGGGRIHEGIDLDLYGFWSSPIFSSCDGTVIRTEWLTYSYGYHVVVDCGDGWTTLYAHMSEIDVSAGQQVYHGTVLGISGLTGFTTGEHLHFEIRHNGAPVNPAAYLPF
ncbi:MAG: peptidoglycan DD-metalloendopeptidase family protein [Dehalococcoidia bacterium]